MSDDVDGQDEEFVYHLTQGAELLGRGELESARAELEKGLVLRSHDAKVLGLLGQAFYKLGQYEQAAVAWQRLVDDNPVEAGARVNLGLASLKSRRYPDAIRQLEIALDLQPEHKKAMGYLGLALLESGDPSRARGWFERTGSEHMVARCDALLAEVPEEELALEVVEPLVAEAAPLPGQAQALAELLTAGAGPAVAPDDEATAVDAPPGLEAVLDDDAPLEEEEAAEEEALAAAVEDLPPGPALEAVAGQAPEEVGLADATELAEELPPETDAPTGLAAPIGRTGRDGWEAAPAAGVPDALFAVADGVIAVTLQGDLAWRLDGLLGWRGDLRASPEVKRFRGRATEQPFGAGADQVHHLTGHGTLLQRAGGRVLTELALGGHPAFFREAVVQGFQGAVDFDNGRLTSPDGDVELVHLRGAGRVVLRTAAVPVALRATAGAPVRVAAGALVGWTGALTPRLLAAAEGGVLGSAVELVGEGRVLVDGGAGE